jgi:hypothetical protein
MKVACYALQSAAAEIQRLWWMYVLLWPLVPVLFLLNFLAVGN